MRVTRFKNFIPHFFAEIRLTTMGCTNRPFYHIGVLPHPKSIQRFPDEILGSFDPMINERNEKLLSINLDRLAFWLGEGAKPTKEVAHLLGMIGFLPVDTLTYQEAREGRAAQAKREAEAAKSKESSTEQDEDNSTEKSSDDQ